MRRKQSTSLGSVGRCVSAVVLAGFVSCYLACLSFASASIEPSASQETRVSVNAYDNGNDQGAGQVGSDSVDHPETAKSKAAFDPQVNESMEQGVLVVRHGTSKEVGSLEISPEPADRAKSAATELAARIARLALLERFLSLTPLNREYVERRLTNTPLWRYEPTTSWNYQPTRFRSLDDRSTPPWTYQPKTSWTYHPTKFKSWPPGTTPPPPWTYRPTQN